MQGEIVDSWKERLPEIVHGYTKRISGIWMRQVYSGWHYPIVGLELRGKTAKEARKAGSASQLPFCFCSWYKREISLYLGEI